METNARGSSTETLNYFLQAVQWRPSLFHSIDLSGGKATWEMFREIAHNCGELKILNMARIEGKISEYPLIQAVKIVELNLSETTINDCLFVFITEKLPKLGILNVAKCYNLTDFAIEKASLPSLRFLGMGDCMVGIAAILCAIDKHSIFAMCVKGVKLSNQEIVRLLDLYPDIGEIGIPTLCGLPEGIVSQQALPQRCFHCSHGRSSLSTVLSVKEAGDGSWMKL